MNSNTSINTTNADWSRLVKTPLRRYQHRICEGAKGKNTIVVLPTGAGKTLIAAALAAHAHHHRHQDPRGGKTLFFVPTQMLVGQQARAIEGNTGLRVALYHGELSWPQDANTYDILVSTPEAFRLKLAAAQATFATYALVVFDEVHHVTKRHPYRKIARLLELAPRPSPVVLGLTATCTYAVGQQQIASDITKLCEAIHITTILSATQEELVQDGYHGATARLELHTGASGSGASSGASSSGASASSGASSSSHSHDSDTDVFDVFDAPAPTAAGPSKFMPHQGRDAFFASIQEKTADPLLLRLVQLTRDIEQRVSVAVPGFVSPLNGKVKVAEWSVYAAKQKGSLLANKVLMHLYEALRLMVVTWSASLDLSMKYLEMTIQDEEMRILGDLAPTFRNIFVDSTKSQVCTQRFARMRDVLVKQHTTHEISGKFRGILFVQQRLTTHILKYFVDSTPELASRFTCDCIYATSGEASPAFRVTPSQSKNRVAQFAEGTLNLLISTSVAEEGMDVPAANCIIRFDPILTPVSLVQGRGRARQKESTFVVMDEREDRTVQQLGVAESAQMNLLQNHSNAIIGVAQSEAAKRKREQAQHSRELSARSYLMSATGNPAAILNQFCQKSDREILDTYKKQKDGLWGIVLTVMGCGDSVVVEKSAATKQMAKANACQEMLGILKGQSSL